MVRKSIAEAIQDAISPVARETLNDRVYRELRNAIMAGAFSPGAELTLRAVAEALGTSLMPVRDAMRRLAAEHALEMRPSRKLAIPVLSAEQFLELRRIRVLLEGEAVELAARRAGPAELAAVRALHAQLRSLDAAGRERFWALNQQYHMAIYAAAGSPLLLSIIESLWLQIGPLLTRVPATRALTGSADPHDLLLRALEAGDPEAARHALETDLTASSTHVMEELARQNALRD